MKPINTSIYDFPTLIQGGFVYVDKTAQIYEIARPDADRIYYLPRPRRFGKSLTISTLKALFQGRRELFGGLAIEKTDWDWEKEVYPVIHLDMSKASSATLQGFERKLSIVVSFISGDFGVPFDPTASASEKFLTLLEALPKKSPNGKYVLLIDEYDAPIAGLLDSDEGRAELPRMRKALHDFYIQAKSHCGDMRFLMVTGVSKFAKTSIFSAFNNPKDLTLDARAADLVGYTHEEMETYFHDHISAFALQAAYSRLPHDWLDKDEREVKRYFLSFMIFANAEVAGEPQHATGRPDAVMRTEKGIYVFEFKFKSTARAAIRQCRERNYVAAFAGDPRPVYYVGVNYSPRKNVRTVSEVVCERAVGVVGR